MEQPIVSVTMQDGGVALVEINRPKANAINGQMLAELDAAFQELREASGVRAIVLAAAGRFFVAGADIKAMRELSATEAERFAHEGQAVLDRIAAHPCPVIAAVHGMALGGGCELAMACDIVLAGEKAVFGQPEVKLGVIPGFGGTQRLVRRVGVTKALDLCLSGRMVAAEEAVQMGLAARLVDGDVREAALTLAGEIAAMGPVAIRLCKRAIHENADSSLQAGLAAEASLFGLCFSTADQKEGMAAFVEKRPAAFTGK